MTTTSTELTEEQQAAAQRAATLNQLIDQGLKFKDAVAAFAARRSPKQVAIVKLAQSEWDKEGTIEIDDDALTCDSDDDGDYVLGWLWVSIPPESFDNDDDEDEQP